jgi:glycerol-3-phosphate dehydrogenase
METREAALERLRSERFDLCVVGGGIVGAGVAALASEHGLSVALVDKADFASGASSASSKLVHGGLRYLRRGDFALVREALHESRELASTVAPHLVRPLRFVLPVYDDGPYGPVAIRSALWLYRGLAGGGELRIADAAEAASLVPSLRTSGLRGAGLYADAQTNDARLCLANLCAAAERGAVVLNYAEAVGLERAAAGEFRLHVVDHVGGGDAVVTGRTLVNAAGAWVDEVRRLEDARARTSVVLSKGVHLVLVLPDGWDAALTIPVDKARVTFAIPWEGVLLLGTTDDAFEASPDEVDVTDEDVRQVLAEAGRALPPEAIRTDAVLARFAGLRVLPTAGRGTPSARRETIVTRGPLGMLTVAGGKLTTYRRIAASVVRALGGELGLSRVGPAASPLPGAAEPGRLADRLRRSWPELDARTVAMLVRTYGALVEDVLAYDDLEPLVPGAPELLAQACYARDREWAVHADDVLRRRTTLTLRGFDTPQLRDRVERLLRATPAS